MKRIAMLASALLLSITSHAWAQKYMQPWTPPRPAYESRVISCQQPVPAAGWKIALDDWVCPVTGRVVRFDWWGIVLTQAQLNVAGAAQHRYVIRIYSSLAAACQPGQVLYTACVVPTNTLVGQDCQGNRVYRFSAPLPTATPFSQVAGTHYWVQISEEDATSARLGLEDFRWSAHRPIQFCPAVQVDAAGVVTQPLIDPCDNQQNDLAFRMYNQTIIFVCIPCLTVFGGLSTYAMEVRSPGTANTLLERMLIEPESDGTFIAGPESPDGQYMITLTGMGIKPLRQNVVLQNGSETPASFFDVFFGDLNGDGSIDGQDIPLIVRGLLQS